ncbi:MAG TPA: glycosyltransferase family 2 protein [Bryobacteraceae bacterium]|nr:glycosyltransferase family 2 protein [Bryobacteraceae bacterium]
MQVFYEDTLSVVIVNYNRKDLLRACLRSLVLQKGVRTELIVVDNGSSDGSAEMVAKEFPAARIVRNRTNLGFCEANNQGISLSQGAFIALLNNDAEAHPNWLYGLRAVFEGREDVGMAACKVLVWEDPRRIDKVGHLIYLDGQNRGRGAGELDTGQYDTMEDALWPDGCAAMYRRTMLDQIGGFDEDFFAYADDAELGLRARIAGWGCVYVPTAVVRHHRGATLGVRSMRRVELIERNRVLLAAKLFPWSLLWLNGAFYLARLGAGAWAALRGRGEISHYPGWRNKFQVIRAMMRADLEAIRMLPLMLRKRREIKKFQKMTAGELRRLIWRYRISLKALNQQSI